MAQLWSQPAQVNVVLQYSLAGNDNPLIWGVAPKDIDGNVFDLTGFTTPGLYFAPSSARNDMARCEERVSYL